MHSSEYSRCINAAHSTGTRTSMERMLLLAYATTTLLGVARPPRHALKALQSVCTALGHIMYIRRQHCDALYCPEHVLQRAHAPTAQTVDRWIAKHCLNKHKLQKLFICGSACSSGTTASIFWQGACCGPCVGPVPPNESAPQWRDPTPCAIVWPLIRVKSERWTGAYLGLLVAPIPDDLSAFVRTVLSQSLHNVAL